MIYTDPNDFLREQKRQREQGEHRMPYAGFDNFIFRVFWGALRVLLFLAFKGIQILWRKIRDSDE